MDVVPESAPSCAPSRQRNPLPAERFAPSTRPLALPMGETVWKSRHRPPPRCQKTGLEVPEWKQVERILPTTWFHRVLLGEVVTMRTFLVFALLVNALLFGCAESGSDDAGKDKLTSSVKFRGDKSEIELENADVEFDSGDENGDAEDVHYDGSEENQVFEDEPRENEVSVLSKKEVTGDYRTGDPIASAETADKDSGGILTEEFPTEDLEDSKTFKSRNDIEDLQGSASNGPPFNGTRNFESVEWYSRTYRDAKYPPILDDSAKQQAHSIFQHSKIDTADLSDCALQGEWKPIGEIHIDSSQQDLQKEYDYLIPEGTHESQHHYSHDFNLFRDGVLWDGKDSLGLQSNFQYKPVQGSFAQFQKLTADAAAIHSTRDNFDFIVHQPNYGIGSLSSSHGFGTSNSDFGQDYRNEAGLSDSYKHIVDNVLSYNQQFSDFGKIPANHKPNYQQGVHSVSVDYHGAGEHGKRNKHYYGQGNLKYAGGSGIAANDANSYAKYKKPEYAAAATDLYGSGNFHKYKFGGHSVHSPNFGRYPPANHNFYGKPMQNSIRDDKKPKDNFLVPPKVSFLRGRRPLVGNTWRSQKPKFQLTRNKYKRPHFENPGPSPTNGYFPAHAENLPEDYAHAAHLHGYKDPDSAGVISDSPLGQALAHETESFSGNDFAGDSKGNAASDIAVGIEFLSSPTNQNYISQNVREISHEAVLQDSSQLTSFTCGKNHDHGTNYHTASFQVADDDHAGPQDLLQYQDGAHVIIRASSNGFEDAHLERKQSKQFDEITDSSASSNNESGFEIIIGNAKGPKNLRFPQVFGHDEGKRETDDKAGASDQTEVPTSTAFHRDTAPAAKYSPSESAPIYGYEPYEKNSKIVSVDSNAENPKVGELENLSKRFQLVLENAQTPAASVHYEQFLADSDRLQDASRYVLRTPVGHGGFGTADVKNIIINPSDPIRHTVEDVQNQEVSNEYDAYYALHQKFGGDVETSEIQNHYKNLPVIIDERRPPIEVKPKPRIPPKRKHPGKQYEVHETSGEKQKSTTEIFPPQKFPQQFRNPVSNFATGHPPKKDSIPVLRQLTRGNIQAYGPLPVGTPFAIKKIKKVKPNKGKIKFQGPIAVRRPVTETVRITTSPVVRLSLKST